jgi:prepilin-type N-terminal cleavage/methylation domain-containing protein
MKKQSDISEKGFTLIEILIVIGIIAILASVVIIAINPARQFAQARDSQRISNLNAILNAIGQRLADNKGIFAGSVGSQICPTLPSTATKITTDTPAATTTSAALGCLVPTYISILPTDAFAVSYARGPSSLRFVEPVAQSAHGFNQARRQFLAQAGNEYLDRIRIAIEILSINMFGQFRSGDDFTRVMHQVGENPVFMARQRQGSSIHAGTAAAGIQGQRTANQLGTSMSAGTANQGAKPGQQFFHVKGLG